MNRTQSEKAFEAALKSIPGGVNSPVRAFRGVGGKPFFVDHAAGSHIRDIDGKEYIDYVGTWGPAILGHAPEVVTRAIKEAADHGVSFGIPNPYEIEMAETIRKMGSQHRKSAHGQQRHRGDHVVHPAGARIHGARPDRESNT